MKKKYIREDNVQNNLRFQPINDRMQINECKSLMVSECEIQ